MVSLPATSWTFQGSGGTAPAAQFLDGDRISKRPRYQGLLAAPAPKPKTPRAGRVAEPRPGARFLRPGSLLTSSSHSHFTETVHSPLPSLIPSRSHHPPQRRSRLGNSSKACSRGARSSCRPSRKTHVSPRVSPLPPLGPAGNGANLWTQPPQKVSNTCTRSTRETVLWSWGSGSRNVPLKKYSVCRQRSRWRQSWSNVESPVSSR